MSHPAVKSLNSNEGVATKYGSGNTHRQHQNAAAGGCLSAGNRNRTSATCADNCHDDLRERSNLVSGEE